MINQTKQNDFGYTVQGDDFDCDEIVNTGTGEVVKRERTEGLNGITTIAYFDRCGCGHRGTEHQHLRDDSPGESTGPCEEILCPCVKFQRKMFVESKTGFAHLAQGIYRTSFRAVEKAKFEGPATQSAEFNHWLIANGWEVTHSEEWRPEDTRLFCIEAERLIRFGEKR